MYQFHYKYIKSRFDANLLFSVTVKFMKLKQDVYEYFYKDRNLFDFSDYPLNSKFIDPVNKNVIGKMKDLFKGVSLLD